MEAPDTPSSTDLAKIGRRVATQRNKLGMTQADLAHLARLSRSLVAKIETGRTFNPAAVAALAPILRTNDLFLLFGQAPQSGHPGNKLSTDTIAPLSIDPAAETGPTEGARQGGEQIVIHRYQIEAGQLIPGTHFTAPSAAFPHHIGGDSLMLVSVEPSATAVIDPSQAAPVQDGRHYLIGWRRSILMPRIYLGPGGTYQIQRSNHIDTLAGPEFEREITVYGRVIGLISDP